MSLLCGGKEHLVKDLYWWMRQIFNTNKEKCPRCGAVPFSHGLFCEAEEYCTHCHLWEPDWEEIKKAKEEFEKKDMVIENHRSNFY